MKNKETRKDARSLSGAEAKITRQEALKKIGKYGKYAALASLGTYILLNPKKAQAQSPTDPGTGFKTPGSELKPFDGLKLF